MRGVICGADQRAEWLLEFWWTCYQVHNRWPVTFFDFGMSEKGRRWCEERGDLVHIASVLPPQQEEVEDSRKIAWEKAYGKSIWQARPAWFLKPFACALTPYQRTLWLDLDCEVVDPLDPLFDLSDEVGLVCEKEALYNSGVFLFSKGSPLIERWKELSKTHATRFSGDQELLSYLIRDEGFSVTSLDAAWNHRMSEGFSLSAHIYHWVGEWGKAYIRSHGGISPVLKQWRR